MILLIEDNVDDVFIMKRAPQKMGLETPIYVAKNGQEALDYLQAIGNFQDPATYPIPDIVFLDLKLPLVHGFDVLTWINQQSSFKNIPVAVLTSSPETRDREKALLLGAKFFLVKPPTQEMLRMVFQSVEGNGNGTRNNPVAAGVEK